DFDRNPRRDFLLHGYAELPVVWPGPPSTEDGLGERGTGTCATEVLIGPYATRIDRSGRCGALGPTVEYVAVRKEVSVVVRPWTRGDRRHPLGRVGVDVPPLVRRWMQVASDVRLQRCLAVAENVVGGADAWADVVVTGYALLRFKNDRRRNGN